jgi:hypothetical protein
MLQEITGLGFELGAGVSIAVYAAVLPAVIVDGPVTVSENELVIVTFAVPLFDGSATLVAITEVVPGAGRIAGAV